MKILKKDASQATLSVSLDELTTINNSLNEICNALEPEEFQTRMGVTVEEARALLAEINEVLVAAGGENNV